MRISVRTPSCTVFSFSCHAVAAAGSSASSFRFCLVCFESLPEHVEGGLQALFRFSSVSWPVSMNGIADFAVLVPDELQHLLFGAVHDVG